MEDQIELREKHLKFSKERAIKILEKGGNPTDAWTSFLSDMNNNNETRGHPALQMGMMLMLGGGLSTASEMKKFIEDFN